MGHPRAVLHPALFRLAPPAPACPASPAADGAPGSAALERTPITSHPFCASVLPPLLVRSATRRRSWGWQRHGQDADPHPRAIGMSRAPGFHDWPGRRCHCDLGTRRAHHRVCSTASNTSQVTNHNFVLGIRGTRLTLTAQLKSAQLSSNLALMQILVQQAANRLSPQTALQRYYSGNSSDANWVRSADDFDAVFSGDVNTRIAIQARLYAVNSSAKAIFNRTAFSVTDVVLPYTKPDGQNATLGDPQYGFIPELYPNFTIRATPYNSTLNTHYGEFNGRIIDNTSILFMGPYRVNTTLSLVSLTTPIINNTSKIETLGWLTTVLDASLISNVVNAAEGLGDSGLTLLFGPNNVTNNFPRNTLYDAQNPDPLQNTNVRFLIPPTNRNDVKRHQQSEATLNPPPFDWNRFPAIRQGYTKSTGATNNAGAIVTTTNENGDGIAAGFAVVTSPMVDWLVVVEQSHAEVWMPIYHLRNVIIACVFGTIGVMVLLVLPVAHFSSQPIRRLRDATRKTVAPHLFENDSFSSQNDGAVEDLDDATLARKEGFIGSIIHYRRNQKLNRAENEKPSEDDSSASQARSRIESTSSTTSLQI